MIAETSEKQEKIAIIYNEDSILIANNAIKKIVVVASENWYTALVTREKPLLLESAIMNNVFTCTKLSTTHKQSGHTLCWGIFVVPHIFLLDVYSSF